MQRPLMRHLYKAFLGAGIRLPKHKNMIMTVRDEDKEEAVDIATQIRRTGIQDLCNQRNCECPEGSRSEGPYAVNKIEQESPNLMDLILGT